MWFTEGLIRAADVTLHQAEEGPIQAWTVVGELIEEAFAAASSAPGWIWRSRSAPRAARRPAGDRGLVLTGRYCPEAVLERADLITDMREVRHSYTRGVLVRTGMES